MMRHFLLMVSFVCIGSMRALEEGSVPVVVVKETSCVSQKPGLITRMTDSLYACGNWVVNKVNGTIWLVGLTTAGFVVYCYYKGEWKQMTIIDKTTNEGVVVSEAFLKTPFGTLCWRLSDTVVELYKNTAQALNATNEFATDLADKMGKSAAEVGQWKEEVVTPYVKDLFNRCQELFHAAAIEAQATSQKCRAFMSGQ